MGEDSSRSRSWGGGAGGGGRDDGGGGRPRSAGAGGGARGPRARVYIASGEPSNVPAGATLCNSSSSFGSLRRSTDGGVTWSAKLAGGGGFCGGQCFYNIGFDLLPGATLATDKLLLGGNVTSGACARQES